MTIGRDAHATVQIDDPRISEVHLEVEHGEDGWRIVDTRRNGVFVDGVRADAFPLTDGVTVRLGDPAEGPSVRFDVTPSTPPQDVSAGAAETPTAPDPGMARAGAAAAARRRELDISQRSLAADGIINAGALISFEKGRSWPRDRTRAKLEEVLRWPLGTINRIRTGGTAVAAEPAAVPRRDTGGDEGSLIAEAVVAAVNTLGSTIDALPNVDGPDFTLRVTAILSDLRQLEAVAARAARIGRVTPTLIRALSTVRRRIEELTVLAATSPHATLGQRLYAVRRNANLTIAETAQAAGVAEDVIIGAEAETAVPAAAAEAIETLIGVLDER